MVELGDRSGSMASARARARPTDDPEMALGARDDVEQVSIEMLHVGDYLLVEHAPLAGARCVIAKRANTNERTARIVGWLIELTGGQLGWWPRGALVWRRRIESRM